MIFDHQLHASHYLGLHKAIDEAIEFIQDPSAIAQLSFGRQTISPQLDAIVDQYMTGQSQDRYLEAHRRFVDLQLMLDGSEMMQVATLTDQTPVQAYEEQQDFALYDLQGQMIHVAQHHFVIFMPQDAHLPCLGQPSKPVKKLILKARIA
ncbi:YhcH/YjgK/YiaL family protein [Thiomicrospira sp. ALE5]|uniref:YhcH/YjgK/YiaL family protein n=1 Tax=Thiomicrospira sp. ALE5 TaxID=748650 RepID=UPI0008F0B4B5|nr:YhcH/YjgK/YiaL family protein [Thiomicrospira sp. ALE5]SFR52046.1 YhcH/YjgK/YiaL family protein [Thiomicrospira sp. ALE5]